MYRFALLNAGILYIYFTNFQKIDEEEYGGPWELTKEGFMTSFALFLVGILETKGVATKYFYDICIFFKVGGGVGGCKFKAGICLKGTIFISFFRISTMRCDVLEWVIL